MQQASSTGARWEHALGLPLDERVPWMHPLPAWTVFFMWDLLLVPRKQGLASGYVLEYQTRKEDVDQAELTIDMASAGHWFGGGALCPHSHALRPSTLPRRPRAR